MIHAALVEAYPTEADARRGLTTMPEETPYRGVWLAPTVEQPVVHMFTHHAVQELYDAGWWRVERVTGSSSSAVDRD